MSVHFRVLGVTLFFCLPILYLFAREESSLLEAGDPMERFMQDLPRMKAAGLPLALHAGLETVAPGNKLALRVRIANLSARLYSRIILKYRPGAGEPERAFEVAHALEPDGGTLVGENLDLPGNPNPTCLEVLAISLFDADGRALPEPTVAEIDRMRGDDPFSCSYRAFEALLAAADEGRDAAVAQALAAGVDLNRQNRFGYTALNVAAVKGRAKFVDALILKKVDLHLSDFNGAYPLMWAAQNGHTEIVRSLLAAGSECERRDLKGGTPLMWAAARGHLAIVKLLLAKGAAVNVQNELEGNSPLQLASQEGFLPVVRLLVLEHGARIDLKNKHGYTPLHPASFLGHTAVVAFLIERGADVNAVDHDARTPLHLAAYFGREEVVRLLVRQGAKIDLKDSEGVTAAMYAARQKHPALAKFLEEAGR